MRNVRGTNLSRPVRLVLDLLNTDPPPMMRDRLHELRPGEWQELIELGRTHQLRPVLYFNLKNADLLEILPREIGEELHGAYLTNLARNLKLYYDLKQIALWLRSAGIPVIALKGAHLARSVYSNIALREMIDLDILVPRNCLLNAYSVIVSHGYNPYSDECDDPEEWIKSHMHLVGLKKEANHVLELHWHVEVPATWSIEEFWERSVPFSYDELEILSLSPEDLLLHLCNHVSLQHRFSQGLRPLLDISQMIGHFGKRLDWGMIAERAARYGWSKGIFLALRASQTLVGAEVPENVFPITDRTDHLRELEEAASSLVLNYHKLRRVPPNLAILGEERSSSRKLSTFVNRIFIPAEELAAHYLIDPKSKTRYWYYLTRMKDLLSRNGWMVRQRGELKSLIRQNSNLNEWLEK